MSCAFVRLPALAAAALLCASILGCSGGSNASTSTTSSSTAAATAAATLTSISPASATAGAGAITLTATGTGFTSASVLQIGGASLTTTFVSSTSLTAVVPAIQLASAGTMPISVTTGSVATAAQSLSVQNPTPTMTAIVPSTLTVGALAATVTITGTGFVPATSVSYNGSPRQTAYVSATQLTVGLLAADLVSPGTGSFAVSNAAPGGGTSAASSVSVQNPAPGIASISPSTVLAGSVATTATVSGTGFLPSSVVSINGTARQTTYTGATQLSALLTAADLASAGAATVTVANAAPGGGTSAAASVSVQNPAPAISGLSPAAVAVKSTQAAVTVTGSGFTSASTVSVNGSGRPTAFLSNTRLMVTLSAADLAATGTAGITVVNAAPGGGTSNSSALSISTAASGSPLLSSLGVTSVFAGSADTVVQLNGTGFDLTCSAQVNSSSIPLSYSYSAYYGYSYSAVVPAASLATAGSVSVDVACPQVTSNALTLTVVNPAAPTLTGSSSLSLSLNTANSLTLTGTNFTAHTVIQLNGVSLPTTYNSSNSLTVSVPSTSVTNLGSYALTAYTPAPGGGTSAALAATPYVALANNSMVYNPTNGLFYLSIPSSAGAPYGNSIVSVDPVSGALGTPLKVGSEPDRMALSSDGTVLWVGLDGASSVAKVNLTTGTIAYRFTLPAAASTSTVTAAALAAVPGSPDSVAVAYSTYYNTPAIQFFDGGVARTQTTASSVYTATAIQLDGTRNELYASTSNSYYTYTYGANGLTLKATGSYSIYGLSSNDDLQILNGRAYSDAGRVLDAESGGLLGTLYSSGTTVDSGITVADSALGKIFVVNTGSYSSANLLQAFDINTFATSAASLTVNSPTYLSYYYNSASHLTRWGSNGLAFRFTGGFVSLRSNLVKDLSTTNADLGVTVSAPSTSATGSAATYTALVTNVGPSTSTGVALSLNPPSLGTLNSITPSQGTCGAQSCNLGSLASGASATVTVSVQLLNAGTATLTATANGSENDPSPANNTGSASIAVTGTTYAPAPTISAVSPAAIEVGLGTDTTLTVTGTNFSSGSVVAVGGTALATTVVSNTQLTAVLPAANYASMGWASLTVVTPAPGGGTTAPVALTYFQVLTAGLNHMVYDPFSRKIMASVAAGSSTLAGNSIVALTPDNGTFGTPVSIGSQPSTLALSSDSSLLYTVLTGAASVARYNMQTQSVDFTYALPSTLVNSNYTLGSLAVQPGSPNTIALSLGSYSGTGLFDFNPTTKTAAVRGSVLNNYFNASPQFLDAADLYTLDYSSNLDHSTVTATGFGTPAYTATPVTHFSAFTINGGLAFANYGGVASLANNTVTQQGYYAPLSPTYSYSNVLVSPDTSLARVFFLGYTNSTTSYYVADGIIAYDQNTYLPTNTLPLTLSTIEGNTSYTGEDLLRWGPDGLALLTNNHLYLMRGAAVVPAELLANAAATLNSVSSSTLAHGGSNTTLTVNGAGFLRGATVLWNGTYRTTTWISSTQLSFAVSASDLASAGAVSLTVANPGASASGAISLTIQ